MIILQGKSEEVAESVAPLVKSALAFAALSCEEGYSVENDRVLYHEHSAVRTGHYLLCFAWNCCLHACLTLCTPGKTVLSLIFPPNRLRFHSLSFRMSFVVDSEFSIFFTILYPHHHPKPLEIGKQMTFLGRSLGVTVALAFPLEKPECSERDPSRDQRKSEQP